MTTRILSFNHSLLHSFMDNSFLNTAPDAVASAMFTVSPDDQKLLDHVIDNKGQIKLYCPITQRVLLATLRKGLLAEIAKEEKIQAESEKEYQAHKVKMAAAVASELAA